MNIKPSYQQVIETIGKTQDGGKLNPNDEYSKFLIAIVKANTTTDLTALDSGEVDTEELASNLRYAISEFSRALKAVDSFND